METQKTISDKSQGAPLRILGYLAVFAAVVLSVVISWVLYRHTVNLLTDNLRERLVSIVRTVAPEINAKDLAVLEKEKDHERPEWSKVVNQLAGIRLNNKNVIFAYILRKDKNDPTKMEFVADSHSLKPYAKVDLDANGIMDDADGLNWPGQIYDDTPLEAFDGYLEPTTNKELYIDQWGTLLSGYAPIKDDNGNTVAVVAVDVRANEFLKLTTQTFLPFVIFIISLIVILVVLAFSIIKIWNKQVQLIAELDRQKDELLSIVSHQLATPTTSVKWYLEMLLDGDIGHITKEQTAHVQDARGIVAKLVDLIGMILDVSRIQLGKVKVDKQELDLNIFFKELITVIEPRAKQKNVSLHHAIPTKLPKAMLDKRLTNMTLENLLSNAIKYTPEGGRVDFTVEIKNGTMFCTVKDTGCGIPEAEQAKAFDKLFRASNVRNTQDGNGFGLYVAKGAVENQGGTISFVSKEGKGTTFSVELPLHG